MHKERMEKMELVEKKELKIQPRQSAVVAIKYMSKIEQRSQCGWSKVKGKKQ